MKWIMLIAGVAIGVLATRLAFKPAPLAAAVTVLTAPAPAPPAATPAPALTAAEQLHAEDEASKERARHMASETAAADPSDGEFKVVQVVKEGVLVTGTYKDPERGTYQKFPVALLTGAGEKVEGDFLRADVLIDGSFTYTDTAGASRTVRKFKFVKLWK